MLKTVLLTLCAIGFAVAEQSPVILWGYKSEAKPSLRTVPQDEFAGIMTPLLKDHMIVAFLEEHLSTNDFLCSNAETQSCYAQLRHVSPKTYYTNVENPVEALRAATAEREFNSVSQNGQLETPLDCTPGKVVFVSFDGTAGKRADALEAHDYAIAAITKELTCPTVYLYTSTPDTQTAVESVSRIRRSTAAKEGGFIFQQPYQFMLFFSSLSLANVVSQGNSKPTTQLTPINVVGFTIKNESSTHFSVSLNTDNAKPVTFDIFNTGGYFNMSNLQYDGKTFFTQKVYAPLTFSFFCGNLTLASTANLQTESLLWNSFQMEAPFGTGAKAAVFSNSWDCMGFVTPGIVMGIIVVALFLIITFIGICWMMDINTMDRFDDPKGKTITINAAE